MISISAVCASDLEESNGDFNLTQMEGDSGYLSNPSPIYVDDVNGDDGNDGSSPQSSFKTFNKALDEAEDNNAIYLANGVYSGLDNTKISITKSVNIIGSDNTTFDGGSPSEGGQPSGSDQRARNKTPNPPKNKPLGEAASFDDEDDQ